MAYQIQKRKRISETLEIKDEHGDLALTLTVDVNIDNIIAQWNDTLVKIGEAKVKSDSEKVGHYTLVLLALVFGDEQTDKLVQFYENNYTELMEDVLPFIVQVVMPKMAAVSAERKKKLLANYKHRG